MKKVRAKSFLCCFLMLFYSDNDNKQRLKVWFLTSLMSVLSGRINLIQFPTTNFLLCLKKLKICYLRYAEHHAIKHTSLCGIDQNTFWFMTPYFLMILVTYMYHVPCTIFSDTCAEFIETINNKKNVQINLRFLIVLWQAMKSGAWIWSWSCN